MRCSKRVLTRVWSAPRLPGEPDGIFSRLSKHSLNALALRDATGVDTYGELRKSTAFVGNALQSLQLPASNGAPARVGILKSPGRAWVHALLGCWDARRVAVPLSSRYPAQALKPLLDDAGIDVVLADNENAEKVIQTGRHVVVPNSEPNTDDLNTSKVELDEVRMLLYTSGTTGKPKGVVWNEHMLRHHLSVLTNVWRWTSSDKALCALPLHHVHGIVNVVLCALYAGARLDMHERFNASAVWAAFQSNDAPNVFMGVPTMYRRLIEYYKSVDKNEQERLAIAARRARLFVAGSAALPAPDAAAWKEITGVPALERYGMTETGMTLSSSYDTRTVGALGAPLPGVEARLGEDGELHVRGNGVFERYWRRNDTQALDNEGWFSTGDVVRWEEGRDTFVMLGRASTDIIKTGGYKVSALEIERYMREVSGVRDAAIVGVPCEELGERIIGGVVTSEQGVCERVLERLRAVLPLYKVPRQVHVVEDFPRNEMGKVQKKALQKLWENMEPEDDAVVSPG